MVFVAVSRRGGSLALKNGNNLRQFLSAFIRSKMILIPLLFIPLPIQSVLAASGFICNFRELFRTETIPYAN